MNERKYNLETAKVGDELLNMSGDKLKVVYVSPTGVVTESEDGSILTYHKSSNANYLLNEVPLAWLREDPIYAGDALYLSFPDTSKATFIVNKVCNGKVYSTIGDRIILDKNKQILESPTYFDISLTPFPKSILVNGVLVSAPEEKPPKIGTRYFISEPSSIDWYDCLKWDNDIHDKKYLRRGLIHLTKDNAIAYAKAMVSAGETGEEVT